MKPVSIVPADLPGTVFIALPSQVRDHAIGRPTALAITEGEDGLSWADLARRLETVSAAIPASDFGRGDVVATLAGSSAADVAAVLGVVPSGAGAALIATEAHQTSVAALIGNADAKLALADDPASLGLEG